MKELINQRTHPITLESGTVLAAAGFAGSIRSVESLSKADQRYVDRGLIAVREVKVLSEPPAGSPHEITNLTISRGKAGGPALSEPPAVAGGPAPKSEKETK